MVNGKNTENIIKINGMMDDLFTKEQQDFNWARLTKKLRTEAIQAYEVAGPSSCVRSIFERWFGKDNLTSRKEPVELLFINRDFVIDEYAKCIKFRDEKKRYSDLEHWYAGRVCELNSLFGKKCKPDDKPKFDVGQKVWLEIPAVNTKIECTINGIKLKASGYEYSLAESSSSDVYVKESELKESKDLN